LKNKSQSPIRKLKVKLNESPNGKDKNSNSNYGMLSNGSN